MECLCHDADIVAVFPVGQSYGSIGFTMVFIVCHVLTMFCMIIAGVKLKLRGGMKCRPRLLIVYLEIKMKVNCYAVLDSASGVYDGPHKARAHGEMMREFERLAKTEGSPIHSHPEHFVLFFIGEYDDETGEVCSVDHLPLCKAIDLVAGELRGVADA